MNGFSASGTFVPRFAHLHPNKIAAFAAGGMSNLNVICCDNTQYSFR